MSKTMMKQNFIPLQSMAYATKKKGVGLEYKTNWLVCKTQTWWLKKTFDDTIIHYG